MTHSKLNLKVLALTVSAAALLGACTDGKAVHTGNADRLGSPNTAQIDAAMERAAYSSVARGEPGKSVRYFERLYKRNNTDPAVATNYANALRDGGFLNRASLVLTPFAQNNESPYFVKTEYSAIQLALGNHDQAIQYANEAALLNPEDYRAFQNLGIAYDMKGEHEKAEKAFRDALERWQGDPTPVMNNLALNLASQGLLDEALEILNKAKILAPDRIEVERNLRIVTALQQSHGGYVPKPVAKPGS